jgi:hypothetical protein
LEEITIMLRLRPILNPFTSITLATVAALGVAGCAQDPLEVEGEPASTSETVLSSDAPDHSLTVELAVSTLSASHVTSNEGGVGNLRDEVYFKIVGQTPNGAPDARLPLYIDEDDYYEFYNSTTRVEGGRWTNQDQIDVGYPRLWNGKLLMGQSAIFQVLVMEQDNAQAHALREALKGGCELIPGQGSESDSRVALCKQIADQIPDTTGDDVIGALEVTLANENGILRAKTVPLQLPNVADTVRPTSFDPADRSFRDAQEAAGRLVDSFTMNGAGASYRADISVRKTAGIKNPLRYVGNTNDKCSATNLWVRSIDGKKLVHKGETAEIRLASSEITWYCGDSSERAKCDDPTDLVHISRDASGRDLHWACFKEEESFTHNLPEGFFREYGNWIVWRLHGQSHCYIANQPLLDAFDTDVRSVPLFVSDYTTYVGACTWP